MNVFFLFYANFFINRDVFINMGEYPDVGLKITCVLDFIKAATTDNLEAEV